MTYSSQPPIMPTPLHLAGMAIDRFLRRGGAINSTISLGFRSSCRERRWPWHALRSALLGVTMVASVLGTAATAQAAPKTFVLVSPTIRSGAILPVVNAGSRADCKGGNQSPPLVWLRPPEGTASYAVSMADLDAKVGVVWLWLMFNIPAKDGALQQNAAADPKLRPPTAAQARNGFDTVGYLGPCPAKSSVAHHYLITVWAVDQPSLPFKDGAASQTVAVFLRKHALGHASLTPHYGGH